MEAGRVRDLLPDAWGDERTRVVEAMHERRVAAGEVVVAAGDPSTSVHLVVEGTVVVAAEGVELAVLGPGSWVGERGWLEGVTATATVRVGAEPVVLASLADDDREVLDDCPQLLDHLRELASRRAATNRTVTIAPVHVRGSTDDHLHLRPMWPDDWRRFDAQRGAFSDESLRRRFFSRPHLSAARLQRITQVDYRREFVWVVTAGEELVAVGRLGRPGDDPEAGELALLVADDWQGRGLGRILVACTAIAADELGLAWLVAEALSSNGAIRSLLTSFGARWQATGDAVTVGARWRVTDALDHPLVGELAPEVRPVASAASGDGR